MTSSTVYTAPTRRSILSKVPEVTAAFWIIKVLATTVGETAADYLGVNLNLGEALTALVMSALLAVVLVVQFRLRRYVPAAYWLAVVLISVVGTHITDNLVDNLGIPLGVTTAVFAIALAATFLLWFRVEKTLSIHSIFTTRRESFYWLTVLFTFALGTAAGDLLAESLNLGYLNALLLFIGAIVVVAVAYFVFKLNAVLAFWIAYVLTRPLGASTGDLLSQSTKDGGLGFGTTTTSLLFLSIIVILVVSLSMRRAAQARTADLETTA
jgi:uncharacterized membrane-anchored protein